MINSEIALDLKQRTNELIKISVPLIIEQIAITFMGVISTIMVTSIGDYATAAVGMIDSISSLIIALFAALTTGGTIVIAQYVGKGEIKKAKLSAGQALMLFAVFSLVVFLFLLFFREGIVYSLFGKAEKNVIEAGILFLFIINFSFPLLAVNQTIFGILRGAGDTATPMLISFIMNVANVLIGYPLIKGFDFWFIHIPSYGVAGAGLALIMARLIGVSLSIYVIIFRAKIVRLNNIKYFKPDFNIQKTVLNLGVPTGIESTLFQVGKVISQIYIVAIGTSAISANTIGNSITGFINIPGNAFATAVMILIGQRIGEGKSDDVKKTTFFSVGVCSIMFLIICLIFYIFTEQIMYMYNPSLETAESLRWILYTCYIATPIVWSASFVTPAALRATGDVRYTMVVAVTTMFLIRVATGYVFAVLLGMGVIGIWLAMYLDWIARAVFFMLRVISNKWVGKGIKE